MKIFAALAYSRYRAVVALGKFGEAANIFVRTPA